MTKIKYDFSGYATKAGIKCSDGRTILKDAFKHNDGQTVPLVWQHLHDSPENILGHALLENKDGDVYCYGKFNESEMGKQAKELVKHGDITMLSIYANELQQKGKLVQHGSIREVSLVLAGANIGAVIDNLNLVHSNGSETVDETEAIIYTGVGLSTDEKPVEHADKEDPEEGEVETVEEVFDTLTPKQKTLVYGLLTLAASDAKADKEDLKQSTEKKDEDIKHSKNEGDEIMKNNVFDKGEGAPKGKPTLTHDQLRTIVADAPKYNGSLKESFLAHAVEYGIENIDFLFPDAKTLANSPEFVKRRSEWVNAVFNGAKHSPFSRIKSMSADITLDTARAKGYVKGTLKKEEFFALAKRITTPTTIYKKQKLDRDDIIDITDLDVVAWLKAEMRVMLDEEVARAGLVSDGRDPEDPDKISETNIRPISKDDNFYAHKVQVPANTAGSTLVEEILRARVNYKGTGTPVYFTTEAILTDLLLVKDKVGRRLYPTEAELAAALRVGRVIPVEVMEGILDANGAALVGILVNMQDYVYGADKGGNVSMFDDFDIDYNQYKYLIETRLSGALVKPKSALVFWRASGTLATATAPTFVQGTNTITIPTSTGIEYLIDDVVKAAGDYVITADAFVEARPTTGYYVAPNTTLTWNFTFVEA